MTKTAECGHGYDEYEPLDEFRDPVSGHFYFTHKCSKCGDIYGVWEDTGTPDRPPYFGNYDSKAEEIFKAENDLIQTSVLVTDITQEIKRYLATHPEKLYDLNPRKFELLIADILKDFGLDTELTGVTRDGGRDIYAYVRSVTSFVLFVECKRWSPNHKVGIDIVQRVYGAAKAGGAHKSMIVTTSFFTLPARREQQLISTELDLKDYNDLKGWLQNYK